MPGPVEVGREHAGGPRVNVEVLGGYGQVCGHFQVQSFDGRTHKAVILMAVVCHSKGTRVTVRKRKRCIEQSPGEARWGWGVAALAVLCQESCGQCPLLTTVVIAWGEAMPTTNPTMIPLLALVISVCLQSPNQVIPCDSRLPGLVSWVAGQSGDGKIDPRVNKDTHSAEPFEVSKGILQKPESKGQLFRHC